MTAEPPRYGYYKSTYVFITDQELILCQTLVKKPEYLIFLYEKALNTPDPGPRPLYVQEV